MVPLHPPKIPGGRSGPRIAGLASWIAAFAVPVLAYLILWNLLGTHAVTGLGYFLFLRDWPIDERVDGFMRINAVRIMLAYVVPLFAGLAGLGWRWICRARRVDRQVK